MLSGMDKFSDIGEPDGAGMRANMSLDALWKEEVEKNFGREVEDKHSVADKILVRMA